MTPLRIFAIKATHNVDFARFSQPLNGFPHCFQHIVESAVEKKKGILPANLPALEPAASVSSTNQTTSYFHFFQARTWIFHDFFHICMFSTPQNFHFFHCYLYFRIRPVEGKCPSMQGKTCFSTNSHPLLLLYFFLFLFLLIFLLQAEI